MGERGESGAASIAHRPSSAQAFALFGGILVLFAAAVLALMRQVDRTADETTYLSAGRAIANAGWEHELTRLHGPIPFRFNQLFAGPLPPGGRVHGEYHPDVMFRGRLGMLPFGLAVAVLVFLWSRRAFGNAGGLLSLALFALNPLMLAYSGLIAVDMAYAAGLLFTLYVLWRFLEAPSMARLSAVGLALGLALATKYLTLLCAPLVAGGAAFWVARSLSHRRGLAAAGALVWVSLVALATLHACYGFGAGWASTESGVYSSDLVRALVDLPLAGSLAALLPGPFLLGVDYQLAIGGEPFRPYLNGHFAPGHWDYYLWTFLCKTPEWVILLLALALARRVPGWLRGRGTFAARSTWWVLAPPMLLLWVYLSFFTSLQVGVRYVLPLFPMAFVLAGGLAADARLRRVPRAVGLGAAVLVLGWTLLDLGAQWPNLLAYYNRTSGGQAQAWRYFADSNSDWGQMRRSGRDLLEATEPGVAFLPRGAGPRFGRRLAIDVRDWRRPDPEDPTRARHWLDVFEAVRHVGACWWVFEVTPETWEAALARDESERSRAELVTAYLGEGDVESARRHLDRLGPVRRAPLAALADRIEESRRGKLSAAGARAAVRTWTGLGRSDVAVRWLEEEPALAEHELRRTLTAQALMREQRLEEATAMLEGAEALSGTERLLLVELYRRSGELERALALLDTVSDRPSRGPDGGATAPVEALREELERQYESQRAFDRAVHGGGGDGARL